MVVERRRRRQERRGRWVVVALLSLLAHGLVVGALVVEDALFPRPPAPPPPQAVALRPISAHEWERRRGFTLPPERPAPFTIPGQVVETAPGNRQVPSAARFVAQTNNRVAHETRARVTTAKPGNPKAPESPLAPPELPPQDQPPEPPRPRPNLFPDFSALAAGPSPRPSDDQRPESDAPPERRGEAGGFMDDLKDLPEGDGTFLNTREWAYAGFFNRLKEAVSRSWHPRDVLVATHHYNDVVSRVTGVAVTIDERGEVTAVKVVHPCGFPPLDEEAVRAFKAAGPFLNPPAAMFSMGDTYTFTFGFHLDPDFGTRGKLPLFRQR